MTNNKKIALLALALLLAGCAQVYYDATWKHDSLTTKAIPQELRVVIADLEIVSKACKEAGGVAIIAAGCFVPATNTIYAVPNWKMLLEEFGHVWLGSIHILGVVDYP